MGSALLPPSRTTADTTCVRARVRVHVRVRVRVRAMLLPSAIIVAQTRCGTRWNWPRR